MLAGYESQSERSFRLVHELVTAPRPENETLGMSIETPKRWRPRFSIKGFLVFRSARFRRIHPEGRPAGGGLREALTRIDEYVFHQRTGIDATTLWLRLLPEPGPEVLDQSNRHIEPLLRPALVLGWRKRHLLDCHEFLERVKADSQI